MSFESIKSAVSDYLDLLRVGKPTQAQNESELARLLDKLASEVHGVEFAFDEQDHPESPDWPYKERRKLAVKRFPGYGFYNVASPISISVGEGEVGVGDAIDDIADIAGDLAQVEWRCENTSPEDALWHFEFLYRAHWGQHLRELQLYLHADHMGW